MEVCMSTAFHRESKITSYENKIIIKKKCAHKMQQRQASKRASISSIISEFTKHELLSAAAGVMYVCVIKRLQANACQMIGYVHFTLQLSDVFPWSMQIRPFLTAFQFAHNLTSYDFFLRLVHFLFVSFCKSNCEWLPSDKLFFCFHRNGFRCFFPFSIDCQLCV